MDGIGRCLFGAGDAGGDFREHHEAEIVVRHPAFFEDTNGEVAEGIESAGLWDLRRNTRRQIAACISEQTGAKPSRR